MQTATQTSTQSTPIKNRYDIMYLLEVIDGNPNGDPESGGMPRMDPITRQGLISDVAIKRRIRDWIVVNYEQQPGCRIYIKSRAILGNLHKEAYEALGLDATEEVSEEGAKGKKKSAKRTSQDKANMARDYMCENYWDVRTHGAVMGLEVNAGQVLGPVQASWARSIDPIQIARSTITRIAVASQKESDEQKGGNQTMGVKYMTYYGLFRGYVSISAPLAAQTGFNERDLDYFLAALQHGFDFTQSASRGTQTMRRIYVFKHASSFGNAKPIDLFERITVQKKDAVSTPRRFSDYNVTFDPKTLPKGVTVDVL